MNFRQKKDEIPRIMPDLNKLAKELGVGEEMRQVNMIEDREGPRRFAPPAVRNQDFSDTKPEVQVKSFGELPTRQIDDVVSAAEAEITALKLEAQAVRDLYMKHTTRISKRIAKLRATCKLSMDALASLKDECAKLDVDDDDEQEALPFQSEKD